MRIALMLTAAVAACTYANSSRADDAKSDGTPDANAFVVVVMDPLAKPLSCPCVEGYAQREYEKLGAALEKRLGRKVQVAFSESLAKALKAHTHGRADLVIGKDSVVRFDAKATKRTFQPIAALTGKDGVTTQKGLIVVPSWSDAKTPADLTGYRIIFGPEECDEKHAAAFALLKKHGVEKPAKIETCGGCADGATKILEAGKSVKGATVISSYAAPLLEGCGTVKKGDLRVVGETAPVPFVVAFVSDKVSASDRKAVVETLASVADDAELLAALETQAGFKMLKPEAAKPTAPATAAVVGETAQKK